MTQPLDLNELARDTAQKEVDDAHAGKFWDAMGSHVLSALTKLAAVKDAEIESVRFAGNAITRQITVDRDHHKAALKVATDTLENAKTLAATEDHRAFSEIRQGAEDALQQIKELKP